MRLYNPLNGQEFETNSDDELHVQVYLDMGFKKAPDPSPAEPGRAPEPVTYEPVKPAAKAAKKTASTDK